MGGTVYHNRDKLNWVDLYNDWNEGIKRILQVVQPEPEGELLDGYQQRAYLEENIVDLMPSSITSVLNDRKRERLAEKFSLVQDNYRTHEYSRQDVDKLTHTQRERLFAADPEMAAWWRGKSIPSDTWPLFRVQGGTWISKDQIKQVPLEQRGAFWEIKGLLDWYMRDEVF